MKKGIHPEERLVLFKDISSDYELLVYSTVQTTDTIKWKDGKTYPLYKMEVSSGSHPFYTGERVVIDSGGRVKKFNDKFEKAKAYQENQKKKKQKTMIKEKNEKQDIREMIKDQ